MMPIRIVFFDIDGTLVDPATGKISPKTVEALQLLEEKGIRRGIVTGRPPASLPDFGPLRFDAMPPSTAACAIRRMRSFTMPPSAPARCGRCCKMPPPWAGPFLWR